MPVIEVKAIFAPLEGPNSPDRDAWDLRREFLRLRADEDFLSFWRMGKFDESRRLPESSAKLIAHMREWQRLIHVLARTPRQEWNLTLCLGSKFHPIMFENATTAHSLKMFPGEKDGAPAEIISGTTIGAILDTIHLEKIEGYKIKCCELPGCLETFPAGAYGRKYCKGHASVATTRRYREKEKNKRLQKAKAERIRRKPVRK